jgi:hypothetical protein
MITTKEVPERLRRDRKIIIIKQLAREWEALDSAPIESRRKERMAYRLHLRVKQV